MLSLSQRLSNDRQCGEMTKRISCFVTYPREAQSGILFIEDWNSSSQLSLSHQRNVDGIGSCHGNKRHKPSNQRRGSLNKAFVDVSITLCA